jgi:3-hydroxyacyl-CoA dehydrogenase
MGGGIAAVLANAGIPVYLLDIAATDLSPDDEANGLTIEDLPGSITSAMALEYILSNKYTVEEADAIMGPLIGRPKTGIFRLQDLVSLDVSYGVGANLYGLIPDDETREVLRGPHLNSLRQAQMDRGRLGDKTGQGFYRKPRNGEKDQILTLDLKIH